MKPDDTFQLKDEVQLAGAAVGVAITSALDTLAIGIATSIELGTAGAFLVAWHGWAAGISAGIASSIVGSGIGKLYKGGNKTFRMTNKYIKTRTIRI